MPALSRTLAFFGAVFVFCLLSSLSITPAHAQTSPDATLPTASMNPELSAPAKTHKTYHKTTHHKKSHHSSKKHKAVKTVKKSKGDPKIREVQTHLANLDYYKGKVDGLNGPKTKAAIKKFQHANKLPATGKLTNKTYDAIVQADRERSLSSLPPIIIEGTKEQALKPIVIPPMPPEEPAPNSGPDFYATHPDFYGHYNQSFENPLLLGSTQSLSTRFAKIVLTEDTTQQDASSKRYNITLNGLPLILVDGQPSVIGVSRTYALGDEDVIIFTTYKDRDPVCAYAYNLLILAANGTTSREIDNCTRGYRGQGQWWVALHNVSRE